MLLSSHEQIANSPNALPFSKSVQSVLDTTLRTMSHRAVQVFGATAVRIHKMGTSELYYDYQVVQGHCWLKTQVSGLFMG